MTRVSVVSAPPVSVSSSDVSERRFLPDLESEVTTLAAWCQVKQQQQKPLSSDTEDREEDLEDSIEECSNLPASLSLDSDAGIKKDFLDRLAELLCYRKDPSLITSTALIYSDEGATIVAARNSSSRGRGQTWSEKDVKMLEYLGQFLERVSSDGLCLFPKVANPCQKVIDLRPRHFRYRSTSLAAEQFGGILQPKNLPSRQNVNLRRKREDWIGVLQRKRL